MDSEQKQPQCTIEGRIKLAPIILAAILRHPHTNDDAMVARAVSLSDKLAYAIVYQPRDES